MNTELKADAINYLTRTEADDADREAAKLMGGMRLDVQHVENARIDVVIDAEPERVSRAMSSELAARIESAVREVAPMQVRKLQWFEQATGESPQADDGYGEVSPANEPIVRNDSGHPSKPPFNQDGPGRYETPEIEKGHRPSEQAPIVHH